MDYYERRICHERAPADMNINNNGNLIVTLHNGSSLRENRAHMWYIESFT